jgi:retrograde regulation protein 2
MPTLYQNRAGISLYDAQWSSTGERQPIGEDTIAAVISSFKQFQRTCSDFGVPKEQITVLATEATRTAINSEDFRRRIKDALGWEVTLMPKEEEGRVGAMGIASSLPEVMGLVMDLGGGSTQLSWLMNDGEKGVRMPESGAISMPYGAAAMSRRLAEADKDDTLAELKAEIRTAVKNTFESLEVPTDLAQATAEQSGYTLYLSGGGFRGWGYLLMSQHHVQPYPIPVINGFKAVREQFIKTEEMKTAAVAALQNEDDEVFRVSDRRASQVPAVAFLINALCEAIPNIYQVRFCQGGVREGYLFSSLTREVQSQRPLVVATQQFSCDTSHTILGLLKDTIPPEYFSSDSKNVENIFTPDLLEAFANMMYFHSTHSKDLQASSALRSTTSGVLAGVHGLLHESRTVLGLLLCARWGDEVPPIDETFKRSLEKLVTSSVFLWFIRYLGSTAALVAAVYPAGVPNGQLAQRLRLEFSWRKEAGKKKTQILLRVGLAKDLDRDEFEKEIKNIEKIGKKKNWIGGKDGIGFKVQVSVESFRSWSIRETIESGPGTDI